MSLKESKDESGGLIKSTALKGWAGVLGRFLLLKFHRRNERPKKKKKKKEMRLNGCEHVQYGV